MIFGAILAGGTGSRMNIADMPKQFLQLGDKPIILHTLEKFLLCSQMDKIYIGVHPNWFMHMEDLIDKFVKLRKEDIIIVPGGEDRNSTIMNIVCNIEKNFGESEDNYIITHDSVRPFVTSRILKDNIEQVKLHKACDTVVGAIDTIVESVDGNVISGIPDRRRMYQGQTPQSFQIKLLKDLYNDLTQEEKQVLTDACKICVVRNIPVYLINGETSNLKITTVGDYRIAQAMVEEMPID